MPFPPGAFRSCGWPRLPVGVRPSSTAGARCPCVPRAVACGFEVLPRHEFHRQEDSVGLGGDELVQAYEVPVQDVRERPEFLLEQIKGTGTETKEGLDRHSPVAFPVVRFVDHTHSAVANAPHDFVPRRSPPGEQVALTCRGLHLAQFPLAGIRPPTGRTPNQPSVRQKVFRT